MLHPNLAYVDPGTGSMVVQVIVGGVAAAGVAAKMYWRRIKGVLGLRRREDEDQTQHPEP